MDDVLYFMRGLQQVTTQSSVLVSSSKYLNDPDIREWVVTESLRRNGRDYPATYGIPRMLNAMYKLRDTETVNAMLAEQRKKKPELDRWFDEKFISTFTRDDMKQYPAGSVGNIFYQYLTRNNFEIQLDPRIEQNPDWKPETLLDYWDLRSGQLHDFDHILGGVGFDFLGEAVPTMMRVEAYFNYFPPELAGELSLIYIMLLIPVYMRTMLHYPQTWPAFIDHTVRAREMGQQSEPWFLGKIEPLLHLTPQEARAKLGMRGVKEVDTWDLSNIWSEGAQGAQIVAEAAE